MDNLYVAMSINEKLLKFFRTYFLFALCICFSTASAKIDVVTNILKYF